MRRILAAAAIVTAVAAPARAEELLTPPGRPFPFHLYMPRPAAVAARGQ